MRTLLTKGLVLAAIGLAICYFTIVAPLVQMSQGVPNVLIPKFVPLIGPFFAIGGLALVLATLVSRLRGADFSENQFQKSAMHRTIVALGMVLGLAVGLYAGIVFIPQKQAEFGYSQGS